MTPSKAKTTPVVLLLLLSMLLTICTAPVASAAPKGPPYNDPMRPYTWYQYADGGGYDTSLPLSPFLPLSQSKEQKSRSCGHFAYTSMLVRSGAKPRGYFTPQFRKDLKTLKDANKAIPTDIHGKIIQGLGESARKESTSNMSGGVLEFAGVEKSSGGGKVSDLTRLYDEGYFLIFLVNFRKKSGGTGAHWVTVDSKIDAGSVSIVDSAFRVDKFPNSIHYSGISWILKFKRADGKKPADLPAISEASTSGGTGTGAPNPNDPSALPVPDETAMLIQESELDGMPSLTKGQIEQQNRAADLDEFEIDPIDAGYDELANISDMKDTFEYEEVQGRFNLFNGIVALLGVVLIFYASILLIARVADLVMGTGIAVRLVTFGAYTSVSSAEEKGKKGLTLVGGLLLVFALAAIGGLLVSGTITAWLSNLLKALGR